jgi:hypothetical protein
MSIRNHPDVIAFKNAAQRYCALLESEPSARDEWVKAVLSCLAEVYAVAHRPPGFGLSDPTADIPESLDVTSEEWSSVFALVQRTLGRQEVYWAYFDPSEPQDTDEKPILHSLADDLADIYGDIKPGLRAWDTGDDAYLETIIFDWKEPLFAWGLHAVSAMRALHQMAF